jgi:anti-sigma B factor antagonist
MEVIIKNNGQDVEAALNGRLDTAASVDVAADFDALKEMADKNIFIDCTHLDFISSSGLRLLLALRKATLSKGGKMKICNVNEQVNNVFALTGFSNLFEFGDK